MTNPLRHICPLCQGGHNQRYAPKDCPNGLPKVVAPQPKPKVSFLSGRKWLDWQGGFVREGALV